MIHMRNVAFAWNGHPIFHDFNLDIPPGEAVLITGINGIGKTTLLRLMAGVLRPQSGTIAYSPELGDNAKYRIGFISDKIKLYESMTIKEAICFHCSVYNIKEFDDRLLGKIKSSKLTRISSLSVGQKTILHLALILSQNPDLLLIDEVLHAIDPFLRDLFLSSLLEIISERPITLVTVNLNFHDIEKLVQRVILLRNDQIALDESIEALKEKVKKITSTHDLDGLPVLYSRRFGDSVESYVYPFSAEIQKNCEGQISDLNLNDIIKAFIGGEYAD